MTRRDDLAALLRKCISLGGITGSDRLREWASRELKGYEAADELPSYRHVASPLLLDGAMPGGRTTGQLVSADLIPDDIRDVFNSSDVHFDQPIAELAALVDKAAARGEDSVKLGPPGTAELVTIVNQGLRPGQVIERLYWSVSTASIRRILDVVRTNLVELIAEMRAGTPAGQKLPSRDVAEQAVDVVITGKKNRVVINQIGAAAEGAATGRGTASVGAAPETRSRRMWFWLFGIATLIGAGAGVWALFIR